jgi:hypothetical protein
MAAEIALSDEVVARRRAWLAAGRALGGHIDDCLSCLCEWLPGCDEGHALRAAADAAWESYEVAS